MRARYRSGRRGVTLIELIAAAVILGALALIVVPNLVNAVGLSKAATLAATVSELQAASDQFYAIKGVYPTYPGTTIGNQPGSQELGQTVWGAEINPTADPGGQVFLPDFIRTPPNPSAATYGLNLADGTQVYFGVNTLGLVFATQVPPTFVAPGEYAWLTPPTPYTTVQGLIQPSSTATPSPSSPSTTVLAFLAGGTYVNTTTSGLNVWVQNGATLTELPNTSGLYPADVALDSVTGQLFINALGSAGAYPGTYVWDPAQSTWQYVGGPSVSSGSQSYTISPNAIAVDPVTGQLAVASASGLFIWNGSTWTNWGMPAGSGGVLAVAYNPQTDQPVIGTQNGTVAVWTGSGWQSLGQPAGSSNVDTLAFDPSTGDLAVGTFEGGVAVETAAGWQSLGNPNGDPTVLSLAFDPATGHLAAGLYSDGIALWTGSSWQNLGYPSGAPFSSAQPQVYVVAYNPANDQLLAGLGQNFDGLYAWTGSGWTLYPSSTQTLGYVMSIAAP